MYSVGDKVRVKTGVHGGAFTGWIGEVAKIYDDGYALPIEVELTRNTEKSFISSVFGGYKIAFDEQELELI
jgi:hypothetical protein